MKLLIMAMAYIAGCIKDEQYKGPDCEPGSHKKDNSVTVGREGDCLYLEDALKTLDPGDRDDDVTTSATVRLLDEYISGTVSITENWEDLVIEPVGSAEAPVVLSPLETDVAGEAIISVTGNSNVTLNSGDHGLTIEGGGKHSGLQIADGASVFVNSVDFEHVVDGVVVRTEGEVSITDSYFNIVFGTAIFAGFQTVVDVDGAVIRGIVPSSAPAIDSSIAAEIDVRDTTIAEWTTDEDVVHLDGDDLQFVGNSLFQNKGERMIGLNGGQAFSEDGVVEKIHHVENNVIVENTLVENPETEAAATILRLDAEGEISPANNTIANNEAPGGAGVIAELDDTYGVGTTNWRNNVVAGNFGFSEMISGQNDVDDQGNELVVDQYNVYYENYDSTALPTSADINPAVNNNEACDPEFLLHTSAPDPYPFAENVPEVTYTMYEISLHYLNPYHYQSAGSNDDCTRGTGDPTDGHNNFGENIADKGAFGGNQIGYLEKGAERMLEIDNWFGVD